MSTLPRTKPLRAAILTTLLPSSGHLAKRHLHGDLLALAGAGRGRQRHVHRAVKVSDTLEVNYEQQENRDPTAIPWGNT